MGGEGTPGARWGRCWGLRRGRGRRAWRASPPSPPTVHGAIFPGSPTVTVSRYRLAMHPSASFALGAALAIAALAQPALAQTDPAPKPAPTMDHGAMNHGAMDHGNMSHMSGWAAMDEFHRLMMASWHPVKDNGDLAPARTVAASMADRAEAWAKAPIPAHCKSGTAAAIARLATDSRAFARLVEGTAAGAVTDAKLREALSALHDGFEKVEKGCAPTTTPTPPPARR